MIVRNIKLKFGEYKVARKHSRIFVEITRLGCVLRVKLRGNRTVIVIV